MKIVAAFSLLRQLVHCTHQNRSMLLGSDRVEVCFNCGSTRRPSEDNWVAPWLWREYKKVARSTARRGSCTRPPRGWFCSLDEGHTGPCPSYPEE